MDEGRLEYKTYDFVELRHVRYVLLGFFKVAVTIWGFLVLIVPAAVTIPIAQHFDNMGIIYWGYTPVLGAFVWLTMGFIETLRKAIEELNSVEKHIESVNEAYWRSRHA